ncbi:MAG: radical SAM protein [Desulfobacterales bacterium]|nr:radical SAM protein [Desulfobacterales bacterium]
MARKTVKRTQKPVRGESGVVRKQHADRLTVALVYPNTYPVGMSSLGFLTVYRLLNGFDRVVCERAFLPDGKDDPDRGIQTVESRKLIGEFDIVAFSLSFENDYPAILTLLEKAGLPLESSDRGTPHPLVVAGGVACFLNPEPIAAFFDCFLLGEAEIVLPRFLDTYEPGADRPGNLVQIARHVPGAYIPAFYTPLYRKDGTLKGRRVTAGAPRTIKPPRLKELADEPAFNSIIARDTTFKNTYLLEVARGCPHGCRFCSAGFVYRPPRFQSLAALKKCLARAAERTSRVGLVGTAVSDLPYLDEVCRFATEKGLQVSFSSLRADALDDSLVKTLHASKVKTATIAPDAGSERMRRIINKGLTEAQILKATKTLVAGGIPNLKVYFMVGLPWETESDVLAIIELTGKIKQQFLESSRKMKKIGSITVSLNPFVPKPFTPFQWCPMDSRKSLQAKIKTIRKALQKIPNVRIQAENLRWSYIQALLARGDRQVAELLKLAHACNGNWSHTFKETAVDPDFYITRERSTDERLPWEFIDHGLKMAFLVKEYQRASAGKTSVDCPLDNCHLCGIC